MGNSILILTGILSLILFILLCLYATVKVWFIFLLVLLALLYVGFMYWARYGLFDTTLDVHKLLMYISIPAVILSIGMTLHSMYRPMRHYPPLFIMVMYALLGGMYGITIGYLGYTRTMSIPWCILAASIFASIVISIFVYTPSTYDTKIDDAEEEFLKNKSYDATEMDKLRDDLINSFSSKNKYYIQWFIVLLYVPICIHYAYRCVLNPMLYQNLMNYLSKQFNLKYDDLPSFVEQSTDLLETLQRLDKQITYTSKEKEVITKIKESIVQKTVLELSEEDYSILKRLRKRIENNDLFNQNKTLIGIYNALTDFLHGSKINAKQNGLYLFNLIVMGIILSYVFVYGHTTKLLVIPLFTIFLSLSIFYLKG